MTTECFFLTLVNGYLSHPIPSLKLEEIATIFERMAKAFCHLIRCTILGSRKNCPDRHTQTAHSKYPNDFVVVHIEIFIDNNRVGASRTTDAKVNQTSQVV